MPNPQIHDTNKRPFAIMATDADKNFVSPAAGDSSVVTSSDPTIITVAQDAAVDQSKSADPNIVPLATGFLVGQPKLGTATITETSTKADGTALGAPQTQDIDCVAGAEVAAGFFLGNEVPQ